MPLLLRKCSRLFFLEAYYNFVWVKAELVSMCIKKLLYDSAKETKLVRCVGFHQAIISNSSYASSNTVEWSSPWKALTVITNAVNTVLPAMESWGSRLATEVTTNIIVISGEEKSIETVCLLALADNGRQSVCSWLSHGVWRQAGETQDQLRVHRFEGVAKYLHPTLHVSLCGGGVHLKRNLLCLSVKPYKMWKFCLLPIHDVLQCRSSSDVNTVWGPQTPWHLWGFLCFIRRTTEGLNFTFLL